MHDGRMAETGTLGREGFTGSETMLGNDDTATGRCIVQVPGKASQLPLEALRAQGERYDGVATSRKGSSYSPLSKQNPRERPPWP